MAIDEHDTATTCARLAWELKLDGLGVSGQAFENGHARLEVDEVSAGVRWRGSSRSDLGSDGSKYRSLAYCHLALVIVDVAALDVNRLRNAAKFRFNV